jgi:hypothetical protein
MYPNTEINKFKNPVGFVDLLNVGKPIPRFANLPWESYFSNIKKLAITPMTSATTTDASSLSSPPKLTITEGGEVATTKLDTNDNLVEMG